jgi:hypothetical protein
MHLNLNAELIENLKVWCNGNINKYIIKGLVTDQQTQDYQRMSSPITGP